MSKLPLVAIIGRPNTGKSTLFNRLIGERKAIESEQAGTTRDHVAQKIETEEIDYLLLDTGGMGGGTQDKDIEKDVHAQSLLAVEAADVILFTINAKEEFTGSDQGIVSILRKRKRKHVPVILVATKCDNEKIAEEIIPELQKLGLTEEIISVSAPHNIGTEELQDAIINHLKELRFSKSIINKLSTGQQSEIPRIAIIGKPNVGKSSIVNALMTEEQRKTSPRMVSPVAGTTRDTTDTAIKHDGNDYILIDTAGLKRSAKTEEGIESFAMLRSIQAIEQADVTVLVIDASEQVSAQDKRIASMAVEAGKGLILLLNKIDQVKGEERKAKMNEVVASLQFCRYAELLPASAVTREGLLKLFPLVEMVHRNRARRIPDKELRRWFGDALEGQPMGELQHSKHLTQAEGLPPTFVIFVRHPKKVQLSQLRYLENRLRETFGFEGTPVRWITKTSRAAH